jgi:patatin-like phospholipase/acyl hydrolase
MAKFRILCLDGGGIMGAFSASVLTTYERMLNDDRASKGLPPMALVDHFDLVTGTSTGGIIAVGLAMGASAETILKFYTDSGPKIFPTTKGAAGWLRKPRDVVHQLFHPTYGPEELRKAIVAVAADSPIKSARTRLAIPTYDTELGRHYIFKTPHHPHVAQDRDIKAADVALATSAAPTYFPAHTVPGRGVFIDGAVWANCPSTVGITEAVSLCGQKLEDIHVLSISTTNYPFRLGKEIQLGGLLGWGTKIIDTFMFAQMQGAVGVSTSLLRDHSGPQPVDRFHRIDYIAPEKVYNMADTTIVDELIRIGKAKAEEIKTRSLVFAEFLDGTPAPKWQAY